MFQESPFFRIHNIKIVFTFLGKALVRLDEIDYEVPYVEKGIKVLLIYGRRLKYTLERKDNNCIGNTWLSDRIRLFLIRSQGKWK